jgi:hypothetical protein
MNGGILMGLCLSFIPGLGKYTLLIEPQGYFPIFRRFVAVIKSNNEI